jgi:carbamoylphosphate synthase large subunit
LEIAEEIGYPVIVRVAYTLGGKGSGVAHNVKLSLKKLLPVVSLKAASVKF